MYLWMENYFFKLLLVDLSGFERMYFALFRLVIGLIVGHYMTIWRLTNNFHISSSDIVHLLSKSIELSRKELGEKCYKKENG